MPKTAAGSNFIVEPPGSVRPKKFKLQEFIELEDEEEEIKEDRPLQTEALGRMLKGAVKSYTFDGKPNKTMKRMRSQTSAKED